MEVRAQCLKRFFFFSFIIKSMNLKVKIKENIKKKISLKIKQIKKKKNILWNQVKPKLKTFSKL